MGASAPSGYDGGVCLFPPPDGHRIGQSAGAALSVGRGSAVAAFLNRTLGIVQQPHWQFQPDFKGLFSAHDYSWSSRCHGPCGLCDYALAPCIADGLVWWYARLAAAVLPDICSLPSASQWGLASCLPRSTSNIETFGIVPFIVQFGLFVSPIAYTTSAVPERWRTAYALNPMAGIIDRFRWCLLRGYSPLDIRSALSVGVTGFLLLLGTWYFRRTERGFADVI
jgi:hypothetical protein